MTLEQARAGRVQVQLADISAAGVDLLVSGGRAWVCEVNPTPGFARLERATGVAVATAALFRASARTSSMLS